ncbi:MULTISPECIES: alkene reductase [unclassified Burkholderia]|uniref:alkene reductase n=1 Tax=unclassified Burkholderia TaxID=2613784 RepID=UPI0021503D0B|nr:MULTISPECIES: alkene reductase [unclassified Burkholderia]MCR4471830.1 alkene reductase [Burkholderia sp. SCN-KJ]
MSSLFQPLPLGSIVAPNRVVMAPMTRGRASRYHVPTAIMSDYYRQRASAGLIIAEATGISQQGLGWPYAPGIWSDEQVAAWKPVTEAVHEAGGRIVVQLWHMGRAVHSSVTGEQPVSASATAAPGMVHTYQGKRTYELARPLNIEQIQGVIADYVRAARNAIVAGFDGVQIHAANGYLIDQFLRDGSNRRDDKYGGSIENRVRLLEEVTQAVVEAVGADRVSVRLSPNGDSQGVDDSDPAALFQAVAMILQDIGVAFLELREPGPMGTYGSTDVPRQSPLIRKHFSGPLILNSDYDIQKAREDVASGLADGISFGRPFLANPDLPKRLQLGSRLNEPLMETWFSQGPAGYLDYPCLDDAPTGQGN